MAFFATPESITAALELWHDFVEWMHEHPMFFGCSGILTWITILIFAIHWLIVHVSII